MSVQTKSAGTLTEEFRVGGGVPWKVLIPSKLNPTWAYQSESVTTSRNTFGCMFSKYYHQSPTSTLPAAFWSHHITVGFQTNFTHPF